MTKQSASSPPSAANSQSQADKPQSLVISPAWRWALRLLVAVLLVAGFWAYNTPQMVVMWDTFLQMCGLG